MELKDLSSNWKKLQEQLKKGKEKESGPGSTSSSKRKISDSEPQNAVKRRKAEIPTEKKTAKQKKSSKPGRMSQVAGSEGTQEVKKIETEVVSRRNSTASTEKGEPRNGQVNEGRSPTAEIGKYLAIDCEMVGVGPNPEEDSALARVYDSFVRPKEKVTDWRTHVSGVSPKDMANARSLEEVQKDVAEIIEGKILIGHAVRNDLEALLLSHPKRDIRDTSRHPPYRKLTGGGSPPLRVLAAELLGLKIQEGAHSSVEDARATMLLFRRDKESFDREHAKKWPVRVVKEGEDKGKPAKKKKKTKKKSRKR
ncbi:RNH70 is involved in DNA replication and RNA processing [Rasamsonia emersonii CBS 393.64]|uniref:RNA exonuclease 4 n=1 Tax=Rasamsonia emersonii (strain ATCC 16479 / CBS 393.64 / IMI 116815) TaxID=1408163 RepID=A0A0F4YQ09_RASE3|nr:RNH70 is involved in DNA replication and RNA processing [Rasamsonia emersonii CBS 393.64]KKA19936.1 RNH70 is involved in DNA replication and RNA processing [Rasamsonia emersonii CBS 393.64]